MVVTEPGVHGTVMSVNKTPETISLLNFTNILIRNKREKIIAHTTEHVLETLVLPQDKTLDDNVIHDIVR